MVSGAVLPQLQNFALPLVDLYEATAKPFLQPVQVPLDGILTLWCISPSSKTGLISKTARVPSPSLLMKKWVKEGLDTVLTSGGSAGVTGLQSDFVPLITTLCG